MVVVLRLLSSSLSLSLSLAPEKVSYKNGGLLSRSMYGSLDTQTVVKASICAFLARRVDPRFSMVMVECMLYDIRPVP